MRKLSYVVIGGLPEPSGGVTIFNGDLVALLLDRGHNVIVFDQNMGEKQERFNRADIRIWRGGPGVLFHLWVNLYLCLMCPDRVLLHTSNTSGLLRLFVPLLRGLKCTVFFHNGKVEATGLSRFVRNILRKLMKRIDQVFVMSATQLEQLDEMGYFTKNTTSIAPVLSFLDVQEDRPIPLKDRKMHILACGHETRIYNYEYAVRLLQDLPNYELHLYLYGSHVDRGYLEELKAMDTANKLRVMRNKDRNTFYDGLRNARLFVRPNIVDSFGISVLDALRLGTPALASDVCIRANDAYIFPSGDFYAFRTIALDALSQDKTPAADIFDIETTQRKILEMIKNDEKVSL